MSSEPIVSDGLLLLLRLRERDAGLVLQMGIAALTIDTA